MPLLRSGNAKSFKDQLSPCLSLSLYIHIYRERDVCVYIYIYIYIHINKHTHTSLSLSISLSLYIYIYIYPDGTTPTLGRSGPRLLPLNFLGQCLIRRLLGLPESSEAMFRTCPCAKICTWLCCTDTLVG